MHKRWLHQVLCSANVAIIVVSIFSQKGNSTFLGKLGYPVYTYLFPLLRNSYRDSSFERRYLFYSMSLLLAAVIFLLVSFLSRFSLLRPFLLVSAGVVSIAAYPLGCLGLRELLGISRSATTWLSLETIAVVVAGVLYPYGSRRIPRVLGIFLLAMHFILWICISHSYIGISDLVRSYGLLNRTLWIQLMEAFLLPILSFLSTYTWGVYVRRSTDIPTAAVTSPAR
jgi:hypothetical protein